MNSKIYLAKPSITELEQRYVNDAIAHGWGDHCYDYIQRFERTFAEYLGVRFAVSTSSCTGGLHLGLAALGVGPGDEVIVPNITWIASVAPVTYLGAKPVLVDIDPVSWCLDPQQLAAVVSSRTKAIIAVHLYGNLCAMDRLRQFAQTHQIALIEDAAEAMGSVFQGQRAGSIGDCGVFSFHGSKTLTTGEGGMWVSDDEALFDQVLTLSNHGRRRGQSKQFWPDQLGYKYKMSNLQAALGCAQLERIDELVARKREIFGIYQQLLSGLPLVMNPEPVGTVNGYWMPTLVFAPELTIDRDQLLADFQQQQIDARVVFWPLSQLGLLDGTGYFPVSEQFSARGINLPSYHDITWAEQQRVVDVVKNYLIKVAA
jgi:perosamine synthetase